MTTGCIALSGALLVAGCGTGHHDAPGAGGAHGSGGTGTTSTSGDDTGTTSTSGDDTGTAISGTGGVTSQTSGTGGASSAAGAGGSTTASTDGGLVAPPDVDPSKDVGDLSDDEKNALCDWSQGLRGGYGQKTACAGENVTTSTYDDQAQCKLIEFPANCGLTVAQWEACEEALVPDKGCVFPSACEVVRNC